MASLKAAVLPSLGTSALLFLGASRRLSNGSSPSSTLSALCSVLSTLVSIVLVVTLSRVLNFLIQVRRDHESLTQHASSAARDDLLHALDDKWFHTKRQSVSRNPRPLLDQTESSSSRSSNRSNVSSNSLFEQVKGTLKDHDFSLYYRERASIYLLNPATGSFLRTTHQRKLAFTSKPTPACLFQVIQATASQSSWSFFSVPAQRFIGQNLMQKLVANSKKVHAWETFQVLQHLDAPATSENCSPAVYLLLSAARFGKGMWVADKTGSLSRFSQSSGPQKSKSTKSLETGAGLQVNRAIGAQRGVYLSKQFDHAIRFVYSSDLEALLALSAQIGRRSVRMGCEPISRDFVPIAPTSPRSIGTLLQAKDATFHVPMLARWNRGDVRLPWLDAAATNAAATDSGQTQPFLETPEAIMSEIMTATVPGSTVSDFLEIVAPRQIRVKCAIDRSALIKSGLLDTVAATPVLNVSRYREEKGCYDLLCDWHAHPRYGMIRALCYRADAGAVSNIQRPSAGNCRGPAKSAASNNLKAAIVEQYHSCTVDTDDDLVDSMDERVSHKAALRTKMYTRGIPYSNCFSIEVLMEVEDIPLDDKDAKRQACPMSDAIMSCLPGQEVNSALQIRWRASVVFSRHIKLKAQIERGALNGVQSSCTSILKLLQKTSARHRVVSPGERQNPILNADGFDKAESTNCITALAANSNSCSSFVRGAREKCHRHQDLVMLPQAFALEAIKGLVSAIADTNLLSDNLSTLPVQLPWRSFTCRQSSVRPKPLHAVAATMTAIPFFESKPEAFVGVLDEDLGSKVTAALFFEALLSDALSYFRLPHADSGTREVDISAWRAIVSPGQPYKRTNGYIRKQVFRMPLNGIPGVEVARVEDFQYYAFVKAWNHDSPAPVVAQYNNTRIGDKLEICNGSTDASQVPTGCLPIQNEEANARKVKHYSLHQQRLEFGMKLFVPALPGGSLFSIEVLAIVEPAKNDSSDHSLRVFFATPSQNRHPQVREHAVDNRYVVDGISRGLRQIWKQIAQTMTEVCESNRDFFDQPRQGQSSVHTSHGFNNDEMCLLRRLRTNLDLPTHDELASRLVEAIATAYSRTIDRKAHAEC